VFKSPLVSIIIVNYNGKHLLTACLDSVFRQTYRNIEVIVVDNGSADNSSEYIESHYPPVRLIKNNENLGYAKGNNIGIENSEGEYIATLNNDTKVAPDWIENLVTAAEKDKNIGICASKQLNFYQPKLIDSAGICLHRGAYPFDRGRNEEDKGQFDEPVEVFGASGASAFYRREMLQKIGLFDEDFFTYQEEFDLSWRAKLCAWKCVYVPNAVVYHISGATAGSGSKFSTYHMERNRLLAIIKNFPSIPLFMCFPFILKYEFDILLRILFSFKNELITARMSALRLFFQMLKKRKEIQKEKAISHSEFMRWISR
jgi:GT2 family glycosyltransferase